MSKQDRQGVRTATDLERKYGFGQSFAEVYDLANDARSAAEAAQDAVSDLDSTLTADEIFNRLTVGGTRQGVYRDKEGNLYVNADYIGSGKVKAEYIDVENLTVKAANVTGILKASQIDANIMRVDSAEVYNLTSNFVRLLDLLGVYTARLDEYGNVVYDISGNVVYDNVGLIGALDGVGTNADGTPTSLRGSALLDSSATNYLIATTGGARMSAGSVASIYTYYNGVSGGCGSTHIISVDSDKRLKNNIVYGLDEYEKLFTKLKPCSFALNSDKDGKRHWGLVAQDVLQNIEDIGLPEPIALVSDNGEHYGVAYGEITSLNTHMIQKLMARLDELEKKLEA